MSAETADPTRVPAAARSLLPLTIAALFLSAALLFAVQPMFAKMVLPRLGGAPGVWSVAMVFFQAMLLAGYAYAHLLVRHLSPRAGAMVHLAVLVTGLVFLPLGLAEGWGRPPDEGQIFWLLGLFAVSVGAPFFAIAANAPLLQAWYSRSGASGAQDPYFLYGASNLGSFIALLGYPILIEPQLRLGMQAWVWSGGYLVLGCLVALLALRSARGEAARAGAPSSPPPAVSQCLGWIAFAFVPSALLVAVTAHITTDIAAAPFLWVIPLALYLLTFVLVFREKQVPRPLWFATLLPILVAVVLLNLIMVLPLSMPMTLGLHLATFFVAAMAAHARLYAARPAADRLTAFYLFMSLGGVLGGAFAGLAAPYVFSSIVEYPFLLVASVAVLIAREPTLRIQLLAGLLIIAAAVALVAAAQATGYTVPPGRSAARDWALVAIACVAIVTVGLPVVSAAVLAFLILVGPAFEKGSRDGLVTRSFFGVHRVRDVSPNTRRLLLHGTTVHGAQRLEKGKLAGGPPEPLTYYHPGSPMAEALRILRDTNGWRLSPVGIVGLGAGSLACYREVGERFEFFEIDRKVVEIARDPRLFTFLSECAPDAPIRLGDARLTLADAPPGYEVLMIDAFSSDAIPVHLLTREAVELYFQKLQPHGVVLLHISNRHLDLEPVVAAIAHDLGLVAWLKQESLTPDGLAKGHSGSTVIVLARRDADLGSLPADGWTQVSGDSAVAAWTDDYSNILGLLLKKYAGQ